MQINKKIEKKDLLIIFNIFGVQSDQDNQVNNYIKSLEQLFWLIESSNNANIRVVVGANLVTNYCIERLKSAFVDKITIFKFNSRYTCQMVTNKAVLASMNYFKEEYESFFYLSSGLTFPKKNDLFDIIIAKMKTKKFGILQIQVNDDHGYHFIGKGEFGWVDIDFTQDYNIPPGNHANFHAAVIHKDMQEFYGLSVTDIHGKCGMESVLSYCCAALRKKYTLLGNYCLIHDRASDAITAANPKNLPPSEFVFEDSNGFNFIPCRTQMFNRDKTAIARDDEALSCGIGYYPGPLSNNEPDWNGVILKHNPDKFDDYYYSLDDNMKFIAKKYFYSSKAELDYDQIKFEIY